MHASLTDASTACFVFGFEGPAGAESIQWQQAFAAPGLGVLVHVGEDSEGAAPVSAQQAQLPPSYQGAQADHIRIVVVLQAQKAWSAHSRLSFPPATRVPRLTTSALS